ncbi:gfo/Idh/MocA family oxidoreductase [Thermanaerosceptrum fracticalcis]|uniref:Gfo/Idh/MocA family oxidoreductase n=1 Tax=Thermanaerosceptrum fracticalcis TaxID=1712410 RepID=A0A7G6E4L3_THEFR|nr:Gfo/Idh/MocA family oxidoreductase [Thermanaerosceptrum fracticalcis]QNB47017.1 gfo/Idh/MocA family oxidoreductase [Thermanaerosceptrum fracticalcis]
MKPVKFAIVGCGRIAPKHAEAIINLEDAQLVAVCDKNKEKADRFAEKYLAKPYYDYIQLLKDADFDAICICTPSGYHAEMGIQAAEHCKHVLVEKPMAMNLEDAGRLIDQCQKRRVKLGVVHQNRFNKSVRMVREALEKGKFGRLTHVNAAVRWNRNDAYYNEASWRGTWELDGGCLMNQAIHNIDLLQWILGPIDTVSAFTATMLRKIEAPDIGVAILRARNGAYGIVEAANTIYPCNLEETLHVFGERGTAAIGGIAVNRIEAWRFSENYIEEEKAILEERENEPPDVYGFGHRELIKDFIKAIKEDRQPAITGEEGRKALEIILAMFKSSETGLPVRLPLESSYKPGGK